MVREIVFDTETTGFKPEEGERLVEIGAVELINHIPTGRTYHQYINPEKEVPEEAFKVHGLNYEFLKNYPKLSEIAQDFIDFVGDDGILVAHNATFDINFINYEFKHHGFITYSWDRVIDTLEIARNKFPGQRNSLDALCKRFNIDNSARTKHGALLDAELLAEVYLELLGGAEPSMSLEVFASDQKNNTFVSIDHNQKSFRPAREFALTEDELKAHQEFLENKIKDSVWLKTEAQ